MNEAVVVAVIGILPQLILVALAVAVVARFRDPIGRFVDSRVSSVTAFGLKVDLRSSEVDSAVSEKLVQTGEPESVRQGVAGVGAGVVERAKRLAPKLVGRTVLWVDDHPEWNRTERRMLRQIGIHTEAVTTNPNAFFVLDDPADKIDVLISDIRRDDGSPGGLALAEELLARRDPRPLIFYAARFDPAKGTPPGALGITNRPDVLLHLVMDALDRG